MRSRRVRLLAILIVTVIIGSAASAWVIARRDPARPNVLLIITDDQRFDQIDFMTQTMKRFATGGTRFTSAFATTPLCCPSRATIFTGQYAHNHGVRANAQGDVRRLDQSTTLQRQLHDSGYQTGIAGKLFNDWDLAVPPPAFDRWAVMKHGYFDTPFSVDGRTSTVRTHSTTFVGEQGLRMLADFEREDDQPWLLVLAPFAPHFPFLPAEEDADADVGPPIVTTSEHDLSDKPPWIRTLDSSLFPAPGGDVWLEQARTLLGVDRMVETIFRELEAIGEENTLAVFVSDNGLLLGEHNIKLDKRAPYSESVRVPLLMRWPGEIDAGATDDRLVTNADIAPTIFDAVGVTPPLAATMDGRSLLERFERREVYLEGFPSKENPKDVGARPWSSTRTNDVQYIEWLSGAGVVWRELYDLRADPEMLESLVPGDIAPDDPRVEALGRRLAELRRCAGTTGPGACP